MLWEMSLFAGVGMLLLAIQGLLHPMDNRGRTRLLVLLDSPRLPCRRTPRCMGCSIIFFRASAVFRGASKFIFFTSIFLAFCTGQA